MGRWMARLRDTERIARVAREPTLKTLETPTEVGFEGFEGPTPGQKSPDFSVPSRDAWDGEDWQSLYEERAAVLEHDGGLPRTTAEAQACDEVVAAMARHHRST